ARGAQRLSGRHGHVPSSGANHYKITSMPKRIIAIVPAAGTGERARRSSRVNGSVVQEIPKQYRLIHGEPMLRWAVKALLADARIGEIRVAIAPGDCWAHQALSGLPRTVCSPCGGPDRAATVTAAL